MEPESDDYGAALRQVLAADPLRLESSDWEEPLRLQSDTGFSHGLGW